MILTLSNKLKLSAAALMLGVGIGACQAPSAPVGEGKPSYGALASQNMADYYYPKEAGWTYVYESTITEYDNGGNLMLANYSAGYDTLKTLGYQGFNSPSGDSVYAFSVTHSVVSGRNNKNRFQLYYVKKGSSDNGGFIVGNNPSGFSNVDSVSAVAAAIDTILYAIEGPARDIIYNAGSGGTRTTMTDKIFYTAKNDEVQIWWSEGGAMRTTRLIWQEDLIKNNEWAYAAAVGDQSTTWKVRDESDPVYTDAGNFDAVKVEAFTQGLKTSATEYKWWGVNKGLVKQYDEWRVTNDGQNFRKKVKVRELVSTVKN
ncbi:MAG TPA: hypothetical protein VEF04_21470 [Blastocatellia bacterium]|nr:hypothetical protein [Blastocatellia bacterium]